MISAGRFIIFKAALADWEASGESIDVPDYDIVWTFDRARQFAIELSTLIQVYNQVLWTLPYCSACGGACCAQHEVDVESHDLLFLALLDLPLPRPVSQPAAIEGQCTYRGRRGCTWPDQWRPFLCWLYFCSGRGDDGREKEYDEFLQDIAEAVHPVVEKYLPPELARYSSRTGVPLSPRDYDLRDLEEVYEQALWAVLLWPLRDYYPAVEEIDSMYSPDGDWQESPPGFLHAGNISRYAADQLAVLERKVSSVGGRMLVHSPADEYPPLSRPSIDLPHRPSRRYVVEDCVAVYVDEEHFAQVAVRW